MGNKVYSTQKFKSSQCLNNLNIIYFKPDSIKP